MKTFLLFTMAVICTFCTNSGTKSTSGPKDNMVQPAKELVFSYNKVDFIALKNNQIDKKTTQEKIGKIKFRPKEITIIEENGQEIFSIYKITKHADGYEIRTRNNKNDEFFFAITARNGINVVSVHFLKLEMMGLYHISDGYASDIPMYNQ